MTANIQIFMGFLVNKELQVHLNRSKAWEEAKFLKESSALQQIQDHTKEYIGRYLSESPSSCSQLKKSEAEIKSQLQLYCPKINLDRHHCYLIPQLFIS